MQIDTVLFDMGGTLEEISYSSTVGSMIEKRFENILKVPFSSITTEGGDAFYTTLLERYSEYRCFRERTYIEVHPAMVWRDWILKGLSIPDNVIFDHCEELAYFWETEVINRCCRKNTAMMLEELHSRDIKMGIISNTGSFTQVYKSLDRYGIRSFFDKIALSCAYGIRKPHGFLFRDILNQMGADAKKTLFVGDTITRDVLGAKNAGLFGSIQIQSDFTKLSDGTLSEDSRPDYIIQDLMSIPSIIDEINQRQ
ncbi:HAD family hydrolase [Sediminispirochaeta smaragdinae]|uniref:HAD-superfamily hydrolase, subfamily IA, variant 1 n=1 Tax=Sediminispirochaeta smaragdinae (strain DSM 11293 / JCM 15392 / SEBR 4228) TaxID=573413 RepID=E1R6G0_SEDSS|nr:HAD family hydrolase [Sediminispirochaeta smaragdinae]ADK80978.1 HAD-superfamily hydrolase, subfamily IA, variant 1 [Sediminispirochaeta smaragdinae DSM 11293]